MNNFKNNQRGFTQTPAFQNESGAGFTLIEILVVIGMIALLAAIVIIAINPARQFAQGRNTDRNAGVNTILNAIGQNLADNKGIFTCAGITNAIPVAPATPLHIGTNNGLVNLSCLTPTYIPTAIPVDPSGGTVGDTGYAVVVDSTGRYTVSAPGAELTQVISLTR